MKAQEYLKVIESYTDTYKCNFWICGEGNNEAHIYQNGKAIGWLNGRETFEELLRDTAAYLKLINRTDY